jgi:hypothetical protein
MIPNATISNQAPSNQAGTSTPHANPNPNPNPTTNASSHAATHAPKKSAGKRAAIVALSALACLSGALGVTALESTALSAHTPWSVDGRSKPKIKKTTKKHKQKTAAAKVSKMQKPKSKAKAKRFQTSQNAPQAQDAVDQANQDTENAENAESTENVENCEYDETAEEYWCDEDFASDEPTEEDATTATPLGVYAIKGNDVVTTGASPATAKAVTAAWKHFATLIPQDRRMMITTFTLIDKRETEYDGQVEETDNTNHTWELRLKAGEDADDFVVVHEFGHLLTLSPQQLDDAVSKRNCNVYRFWEGCPRPNSFSGRFINRFWTPDMVRQAEANSKRFEKRNPGAFVRDYSATNPGEDLADTFAEFVTNAEQPKGNRIVDQKINMFWADPDMMFLRTQIRANGKF